jgi:type I restriction enzyme R subunit
LSAEVETLIRDSLWVELPTPPFSDDEKQTMAGRIYQHVWRQSANGVLTNERAAETN